MCEKVGRLDPRLVLVWVCCLGQTRPKTQGGYLGLLSYFDLNIINVSIYFIFGSSSFSSLSLSRVEPNGFSHSRLDLSELE